MDFAGIAKKWESQEILRIRVRETKDLFVLPADAKWVEPTRANAVSHSEILLPALDILRKTPDNKLPYLVHLQAELGDLYQNLLGVTDEKKIYRNAQELKRLLGLVKRKAAKKELTKDPA